MKRTAGLRRSGPKAKPDRAAWDASLGKVCEFPGCEARDGLKNHHVIHQQHVRGAKGDEWDPLNAFTICRSHHRAHHDRRNVIPLTALGNSVFVFAVELWGCGKTYAYLRRYYSGSDPRMDMLLEHAA